MTVLEPITAVWGAFSRSKGRPAQTTGALPVDAGSVPAGLLRKIWARAPPPRAPSCPHRGP